MNAKDILKVSLLADMQNAPVSADTIIFLVGKDTMGDGLGGFYRWDASATGSLDAQYLNIVPSNKSSSGRWVRIFQRARNLSHGVLVNNGGVKSFYAPSTVDANSQSLINLTEENTANGTAIFSEVWSTNGESIVNVTDPNDVVIGVRKTLSANKKQLTYYFARGNTTTLGSALLNILGLVIPALRPAAVGTSVIIKVEGI